MSEKTTRKLCATFDYNLKSRQHSLSLEKWDFGIIFWIPADHYLMEVKILGAIPLWLTHALTELRYTAAAFQNTEKLYALLPAEYRQNSDQPADLH